MCLRYVFFFIKLINPAIISYTNVMQCGMKAVLNLASRTGNSSFITGSYAVVEIHKCLIYTTV